MRLFSVLFWGVFLVASGVIVLLSHLLRYQVATARMIFGVFVLLVGISLLTTNLGFGKASFRDGNTVAFSSRDSIEAKADNEYAVLFGSADVDLTKLQPGERAKVTCLFGSCTLLLPAGEVKVAANSVFGSIHHPDGSVSFGQRDFGSWEKDAVVVEVTCAFGSASAVKAR